MRARPVADPVTIPTGCRVIETRRPPPGRWRAKSPVGGNRDLLAGGQQACRSFPLGWHRMDGVRQAGELIGGCGPSRDDNQQVVTLLRLASMRPATAWIGSMLPRRSPSKLLNQTVGHPVARNAVVRS